MAEEEIKEQPPARDSPAPARAQETSDSSQLHTDIQKPASGEIVAGQTLQYSNTKEGSPTESAAALPPSAMSPAPPTDAQVSRPSSLEESSPAPSANQQQQQQNAMSAPAPVKKRSATATPKGIAVRKPATKKRKVESNATETTQTSTSTTTSRAKKGGKGVKTETGSQIASSPAPEPKKVGAKKKPPTAAAKGNGAAGSGEVFCICRTGDDHTWMIGCDGGCEDWFHGKCVNINEVDCDLIDKYICPACEERQGVHTTWKPMCRLPRCRKPARVATRPPSKYCSDEHGVEFMRLKLGGVRPPVAGHAIPSGESNDDLGAKGGPLSAPELKAIVSLVNSTAEFRTLGNKEDSSAYLELEADNLPCTPKEREVIQRLQYRLSRMKSHVEMLRDRERLIGIVRQHAKNALEHLKATEPKAGWKDICGFNPILSLSDKEFNDWRLSATGKSSLEAGQLPEPSTGVNGEEDKPDEDGDVVMNGVKAEADAVDGPSDKILVGVCLKKRCERHRH
ncbi:hypothetical protein KEM55_004303 [Ascosphaera atra]|nr:hypothetical protein KEM55_004303 [Ascosphaera atra]